MKAYELLKVNEGMIRILENHSLLVADIHYIPVIDEYIRLLNDGEKKTYIVQILSDKYGLSERTVYRLIDKLMCDVSI